jgi:hypothetical protein
LTSKCASIDRVAIPQQVPWHIIHTKRFEQLPGSPCGGGMLGDIEVQNPPSIVAQNDQYEQNPKGSSRDREEINGHKILGVIFKKCAPCL